MKWQKKSEQTAQKSGKGDITKSISRLSMDTVEVFEIIKFLRARGINMHFECLKSFK